jgi:hypothetical protein
MPTRPVAPVDEVMNSRPADRWEAEYETFLIEQEKLDAEQPRRRQQKKQH